VAQHDIGWGELGIEWVDRWYDENNGWKEGYLTRGLGYLHQLVHAPTYEARYNLLSFSDMEKLSLYDGLIQQPQSGERPFSEYSPVERDAILNHPCPADSDKGPRDAWLWAHQDSECHNLYNARYERHAYLRKCGYVMWDAVRWRDWGLLDTEWDDCRVEVQERENLPQDITSFVEVQESWKVRSQIHARGGKGWWAPGDLSRVVWRSGKPPDDWPPKEIKKEVKKGKKDKWQVEAPPPREKSPELPSDLAGWSKFFEQKAKTSRS